MNKKQENVNKVYFDGSHSGVMHVIREAQLLPCSGVRLPLLEWCEGVGMVQGR